MGHHGPLITLTWTVDMDMDVRTHDFLTRSTTPQACDVCQPGKPCEQCSGSCIVCLGLVPPGPKQLSPEVLQV